MIELRFEADIRAPAERVFSLLAELRDYDRWLPKSSAFKGTSEISPGPIAAGTTYIEDSPVGVRRGKVTEFVPPSRLCFEQPMTLKPGLLGVVGIQVSHTLTAGTGSVHVLRVLQITPQGFVALVMPFVLGAFKTENERMLQALKKFAEH